MRRIAGWLLLAWALAATAGEPRRQVGHVEGVPVYADQIAGETVQARADAARSVFMAPLIRAWAVANAQAARPTAGEAAAVEAAIARYAACSGNGYPLPEDPQQRSQVIGLLVGHVKLQQRLHAEYGGGRLLFQQAGVEAFDATRTMLERMESEGRFAIADPDVRATAYDYWTRDHGAFIITDPARIAEALDATSMVARCPGA